MTLFRLYPIGGTAIDAAIAAVSSATLTRRRDGAFADVGPSEAPRFVRALALAGVAAQPCAEIQLPQGTVPSVGSDLEPCRSVDVDVLTIRVLSLGEATTEVTKRRWAWLRQMSSSARDQCRSLLRGEDALFVWRRIAWARRETYRDATVRRSLRPLVFDRSAIERVAERRAFAHECVVSRWLFA